MYQTRLACAVVLIENFLLINGQILFRALTFAKPMGNNVLLLEPPSMARTGHYKYDKVFKVFLGILPRLAGAVLTSSHNLF